MTRIAYLDTETSGTDPTIHEVWEVAALLRDTDTPGHDAEHRWQLAPDLDAADDEALKVGRFRERFAVRTSAGWDAARITRDLVVNLHRHEAVEEIQHALRDAWIVGANPGFDDAFLRAAFRRVGCTPTWQYRLTDVESMVMTRMGWATPRSLRESAEALGITVDRETRHTAAGDAALCRAIYDTLIPGGAS